MLKFLGTTVHSTIVTEVVQICELLTRERVLLRSMQSSRRGHIRVFCGHVQSSCERKDKNCDCCTVRAPILANQDYLANAPSGVDTGALIQAFADVPSGDVPVFRQLLQAVAICTNGEWVLRDTDREE